MIRYELKIAQQPKYAIAHLERGNESISLKPSIFPTSMVELLIHDSVDHSHTSSQEKSESEDGVHDEEVSDSSPKEGMIDAIEATENEPRINMPSLISQGTDTSGEIELNEKRDLYQNPHLFVLATLTDVETGAEIHFDQDTNEQALGGMSVSSLYHIKGVNGTQQYVFVFPELHIHLKGQYRLKFSLFENVGEDVVLHTSVKSDRFSVSGPESIYADID